jgi:hypothetical protein
MRQFPLHKRRGNPNWGKRDATLRYSHEVEITEFESMVTKFGLTADQIIRSTRLREWAKKNKNNKYVPEYLLEAWRLKVDGVD